MEYKYNDITYNKRPLTSDVALIIVEDDLSLAVEKSEEFEKLVRPYKLGELAGQQDSCPVADLSNVIPYIGFLKETFEGFRIRNAQFSGVIAVNGTVDQIDEDTAAYLIAVGSVAVVANKFENGADKILLSKGILPLVSQDKFEKDTFILIRNIKGNISGGKQEAYVVTPDSLTPVNVSLGSYNDTELKAILN